MRFLQGKLQHLFSTPEIINSEQQHSFLTDITLKKNDSLLLRLKFALHISFLQNLKAKCSWE